MANHFFLDGWISREPYTSPRTGRDKLLLPPRDRAAHGSKLKEKFELAWQTAKAKQSQMATVVGNPDGFFVQFESDKEFLLDLKKFDLSSKKIELVSVKEEAGAQLATVFIPEGGVQFFLKRFEDYLTREHSRWGKPMNRSLVESISDLRLATVEALWTEPFLAFPTEDKKVWWEIWLRADNGKELTRFRSLVQQLALKTQPCHLSFLDRTVVLCEATPSELTHSLELLNDFAELRLARDLPSFFLRLTPGEQANWSKELKARIKFPSASAPAVCVLDTGLNRAHPLLQDSLNPNDLHAYMPEWHATDHDGHGTAMAGLALFGDLTEILASTEDCILVHLLESAKVLPPQGENDPNLYGHVNIVAASKVEIANPKRQRVFLMAVSATAQRDRGLPTSWSATIDDLAAGIDDSSNKHKRLFVIAAGSRPADLTTDYFNESLLDSIHDPGQSWNALTIGAYTDRILIGEQSHAGWSALARAGELSPRSTTSRTWSTQWPLKPDIVEEGGNYAISPNNEVDSVDSLALLTTSHEILTKHFTTSSDTSAAAALAANMAATIQARYPQAWPETIRAIMIHSARWSPQMEAQAFIAGAPAKQNLETLLRCFGYGVPDLQRATESTSNALTLVAQEVIYPFERNSSKEMIVHELPWPVDVLSDLGATEVKLRVTLSYFIEANPARRGWTKKHRYASHGLRFDVKTPTESKEQFRARLNKQAQDEEDGATTKADSAQWLLGPKLRTKGSVHSDVWTGTAADLAARGFIGIYPVLGWWRERHQLEKWKRGARYSLIVSIETDATNVDLYVPIENIIQEAISTEILI